jgi:type IV fimbrial biogenesis protein FimT
MVGMQPISSKQIARAGYNQSGFSLYELLTVMAIVSILVTIAGPSFRDMYLNTQMASLQESLSKSVLLARSEAVDKGDTVAGTIVCASVNAATCSGAATWETGWIVQSEANDGTTTVLRVFEAVDGVTIRLQQNATTTLDRIEFADDGFPRGAGQQSTFVICDSRGASEAEGVVINGSGHTRRAVDTGTDGVINLGDSVGGNVPCP